MAYGQNAISCDRPFKRIFCPLKRSFTLPVCSLLINLSKTFCTLTIKPLVPFKSFVMNNKAFRTLFCNPQKSFHTSPTQIIEAVNHFSNAAIAFTKNFTASRNFLVNAIVEFKEWLTASIIRVGRFQRGVKFFCGLG